MLRIAKDLSLPEEVATQTIGVLGIRGSGKTNTAGVIVEELSEQNRQVVIIDPTDAHWGYRLTDKGKPSKHQIFVFGGEHGDLPLREQDGKMVAEFLVEEHASVVLSLRHLRKNAQRRFVTELADELYHLKGRTKHRTPLTLVIDEAPLFVPQSVTGEVARTVGAIEDLVARGRNAGFGVVLISQRAATLNKNVLTQAETIVCHRLTSPQDKKALREWFEDNVSTDDLPATLVNTLPTLADGQAWVWSPRCNIMDKRQIRLRHTFDSSATPKPGAQRIVPAQLGEVDLKKLEGRMASAVAEQKANDPAELKKAMATANKKIADLEKAVAAAPKAAPPTQPDRIGKAVIERATKAAEQLVKTLAAGHAKYGELITAAEQLRKSVNPPRAMPAALQPPRLAATFPGRPATTTNHVVPTKPRVAAPGNGSLPDGEGKILRAVLQFENPTKDELTTLTGYKRSTRDAYIQRLRNRDFVVEQGGRVMATDAGREAIGDFEPLPTGTALQEYWLARLPEGEAKVLRFLLDHPDGIDGDSITDATDYKRSTRDAYLQRLESKRLVVRSSGRASPSPTLYD